MIFPKEVKDVYISVHKGQIDKVCAAVHIIAGAKTGMSDAHE